MLSAATTLHTTATGPTTTTVAAVTTTADAETTTTTEGEDEARWGSMTRHASRGSAGRAAEANEDWTDTGRVYVRALGSICLSPERPVCRAFDS